MYFGQKFFFFKNKINKLQNKISTTTRTKEVEIEGEECL